MNGWVCDLGRKPFAEAWELQKQLVLQRQADEIPDCLLLVEHPPVYTLGKGGKAEHLLVDRQQLEQLGAEFVPIDRGGDITFHGPGQLVAYPILNLREYHLDVHQYLRALEEVTIQALTAYGVAAGRLDGLTGVWVDGAKIAAIGVRLSRWVSMHGIAVNVAPDLSYFRHIIPCGLAARPVTSLEKITGKKISIEEFSKIFIEAFEKVFGVKLQPVSAATLLSSKAAVR